MARISNFSGTLKGRYGFLMGNKKEISFLFIKKNE